MSWRCFLTGVVLASTWSLGASDRSATTQPASGDALEPRQWREIEHSVDQGLSWLATQQKPDGSFPTIDAGEPAVTALCVLAAMSRGYLPGEGPYGKLIDDGLAFVLGCQHPDGVIVHTYPKGPLIPDTPVHTVHYNHAIAALCLSEAYGMTTGEMNRRMRAAIESALTYTYRREPSPKRNADEKGGWRYGVYYSLRGSDISVTSWHLFFLRSAANAGFDVPTKYVDEALGFVRRCYRPDRMHFVYSPIDAEPTPALTGAGILCLSLGGDAGSDIARHASEWLLRQPVTAVTERGDAGRVDYYAAFHCSHGMFKLGAPGWPGYYRKLADALLKTQEPTGAWPTAPGRDAKYGQAYATAMAVLTLTTPDQLLPIFQR